MADTKTKPATKPLLDMEEAKLKAALAAKPEYKTFKVIIFGADAEGPAVFPKAGVCGSKSQLQEFPRNVEVEIDERYIEMMKARGRWVTEQEKDKDGNPFGEHKRTFRPRFKYSIIGEVK